MIPYRETLQRIADNMIRQAMRRGRAVAYPPSPISPMELRWNGTDWALRVSRPTQIPRSRWVDAFGIPAGTPEREEAHAVYWFWCTDGAAWTVTPPLIEDVRREGAG